MSAPSLDDLWEHLPGLLTVLQSSDIRELHLCDGGIELRLHRADEVRGEDWLMEELEVQERIIESLPPEVHTITSQLVGTFYRADHPGSAPLVSEGTAVQEDTIVGIIESLTVLTEVEAGCSGIVTKVFATDGQPVEYGQALFEVRPGA